MTSEAEIAQGNRPRYALVHDDSGAPWGTALDLEGFFDPPPGPDEDQRVVELIGCSAQGPLFDYCSGKLRPRRVGGNAVLHVLDYSGTVIGRYHVTVESAVHCAPSDAGPGLFNITLQVLVFDSPEPLAGAIWERWRREPPRAKNLWAGLSEDERRAWLEVVQMYHGQHRDDAPPGRTFVLDGSHITDTVGFYCAIGEAINGPGGYFGANLDALDDCLNGGFGATVPFTLIWRHSDIAREHLSRPDDEDVQATSYLTRILRILDAASVDVRLE